VSPNNQRDTLFLWNFASLNVVDELKRLPGLADVTSFGAARLFDAHSGAAGRMLALT